jgi:hypothetical protein
MKRAQGVDGLLAGSFRVAWASKEPLNRIKLLRLSPHTDLRLLGLRPDLSPLFNQTAR